MFIKLIKNIQNNINKSVFFVFLFISIFIGFVSSTGDLLDQAFKPSMIQQWLIDLWNDKDAVGNEVLKWSINVNFGDWVSVERRAPLIVRIAKLLLRMTIVLSITMILYNGILYIIQSSKWESPKDPQKNLINIWIWILIALSSLWIINLISSISMSSLNVDYDWTSVQPPNNSQWNDWNNWWSSWWGGWDDDWGWWHVPEIPYAQ